MARRIVLLLAIPAGLLVGVVGWLLVGDGDSRALAATQAKLVDMPRVRAAAPTAQNISAVEALLALPFFNQRGPVRELAVRLEGIARSPGRMAALLTIDDAPAQWVNVGETVGAVTLVSLTSSSVVLDTPIGPKDLSLGSSLGSPATVAAASPTNLAAAAPPPGYRGPPPPASAPGGVP